MSDYSSILLENAVNKFASLPGIGKKTALRLVLNLLRRQTQDVDSFAAAITDLRHNVKYCRVCHNITDQEVCPICASNHRERHTICVVENVQDVISIENTGQYRGLYHVLGGVISPMDGIGPSDIEIESLVARIIPERIEEVILALPTTMEGDTTNFYIFRRIQTELQAHPSPVNNSVYSVRISQIARGVAVGNDLEYTDEITLGRSIINRTPFKA